MNLVLASPGRVPIKGCGFHNLPIAPVNNSRNVLRYEMYQAYRSANSQRRIIVSYFAANRTNKSHLSRVQKWDAPVARMSTAEKQLCRRDELWPRVRSSTHLSRVQKWDAPVARMSLQRNSFADVTSYGRGYDRRDRCFENPNKTIPNITCPCGQCTRKRLRRAHAVDYRRHERWWATPVVELSKLVVSSMKLTKRVS
jgi:hypothetical protein